MKKFLIFIFILSMIFIFPQSIVNAQPDSQRVIVQFKDNIAKNNYQQDKVKIQSKDNSIQEYKNIPAISMNVSNSEIKNLKNNPDVVSIEPDYQVQIQTSNYNTLNWTTKDINIQTAWNGNYTGKGIKIAVIDTGIDTTHPALTVSGGMSVFSDNSYQDDNGHGTHVAGIIASKNNPYVVGVAPDVQLYAVKVLNAYGSGWVSNIIAGIDWAITNKMDIINLSLGINIDVKSLHNIVDKANDNGILIVTAAGNNGNATKNQSTVIYPAKYESAIAVSAINELNNISWFSSTGTKVEISAPGENILSTMIKNSQIQSDLNNYNGFYAHLSGTSMATPFVTGTLAILKQEHPNYTNTELRDLLDILAKDIGTKGRDSYYGFGLLQVSKHSPNDIISIDRLAGQDRYETAVKISQKGWNNSDTVVLASGEDFPDALVGSPLAYKLNAPILLTMKNNLPIVTQNELIRLQTKNVFILGGTGVISENIENQLKQQRISVQRIFGRDRYETAQKVAQQLGNYNKAIIAYGENYPDTLGVASYAAKNGIPILLTETNILPNSTKDALSDVNNTIVVGGNGVIDNSVYNQLPNPIRIYGNDRFSTDNAIFEQLNLDSNKVYITTSNDFADSLSGSVLSAKENAQIVLVDKYITSDLFSSIVKKSIDNYEILGGTGVINVEIENLLRSN